MARTFTGEVQNGVVVLDEGTAHQWDKGAHRADQVQGDFEALRDLLLSVAGKAQGLPVDLAAQHDHYLHGQPKQ